MTANHVVRPSYNLSSLFPHYLTTIQAGCPTLELSVAFVASYNFNISHLAESVFSRHIIPHCPFHGSSTKTNRGRWLAVKEKNQSCHDVTSLRHDLSKTRNRLGTLLQTETHCKTRMLLKSQSSYSAGSPAALGLAAEAPAKCQWGTQCRRRSLLHSRMSSFPLG
jgi:hypothetical protein